MKNEQAHHKIGQWHDQTLVVFETTSNGTKTKKKELKPRKMIDVQASNFEIYDYLEEKINDNDIYKTFGVWTH
jgi:hypothetical protein